MGFGRFAAPGSFTRNLGAGLIHRGAVCKAHDAWTRPDVNSPFKAKTENSVLSTDANLAILPVAPVAKLVPNVLLGIPLDSLNEAQRGILATGQPLTSTHFTQACAVNCYNTVFLAYITEHFELVLCISNVKLMFPCRSASNIQRTIVFIEM